MSQSSPTIPAVACPDEQSVPKRWAMPPRAKLLDEEGGDGVESCVACGGHHGAVGALVNCMKSEIFRLRAVSR